MNDAKRDALEEDRVEVRQEVYGEAYKEGCEASAKRLKGKGISLDLIAECTGLPLATVEAI